MGFDLGGLLGTVAGGLIGADASGDAADAAAAASRAGVAENRRQFDTVLNLQAPAINTGNAARSMLASILGLTLPEYTYSTGTTVNPNARQPSGAELAGMTPRERRQAAANYRRDTQPVQGGVTFTQPATKPVDMTAMLENFPGYKFAVEQAQKAAQATGSATGSLGGNVISALGQRVGGQIAMPTFNSILDRLEGLSGGGSNAGQTASAAAINTGNSVAQGLQSAGNARASGILGQAGSQIGTIGGILSGLGNRAGAAPASNWTPAQQAIYNGYANGW